MCGILAVLNNSEEVPAAVEIAEGLGLLQHRGQDACGVVSCHRGRFHQNKANGMVRDVLDTNVIASMPGYMAVGHVRYPTAGSSAHAEAQPFYVNSPYGIVFAHNGNLINTEYMRTYLDTYGHRHINTDSDSELLLNYLADNLQRTGKFRIDEDDIFRAVGEMMRHCHGAFACVAMLAGFGIIAFRDPHGIRPCGYGRRANAQGGQDWMMSSESVVCDALGFSDWRDVQPGEVVVITRSSVKTKQVVPSRGFAPDIFEYVYFARPDSVLDGISVYRSRMAMGDALAAEARSQLAAANLEIDVVIPVPDTSRVAALQVAQCLGVPYREGFVKNRYVGRTFIMPGQQMRRKNVRRKLNAMALEFKDKNVLLVDDSIVRGTTSKEIIQMARDAGARKVVMASCAPPIRFPNVYGIDMPSRQELVAHGRSEHEIATAIGADLVVFQTLDALVQSCRQFNPAVEAFDCSVFTGQYVTGGVDESYLRGLESIRNDNAKAKSGHLVNGQTGQAASSGTLGNQAQASNGFGCSGPMNGSDAVGLSNESLPALSTANKEIALGNSFHSSMRVSDDPMVNGISESQDIAGGAGAGGA
ncbi:uncharacterized protein L969DRAFT_369305 [Mixia osmundae IAM 14324]|uniref:Amidophosphoribosyltransferase n=1 Tax=Mixia osmundae (strain CBS 9802 / IAM 14324 / JCM 22182 / KY 12970) TaxID=764103 RepID=G7DU89_MIXOS|nr:uncharacterized protein L969DRAFT_369305 [Mixia osmundae IAM 14324]KEI41018.1 hypothetical protein L969DRAFT_369305 [Mixia osmundae IAM 14324]GAA94149.1 hypothetical protein E5Q_00797 [Mixia osmundae IAM 14324]